MCYYYLFSSPVAPGSSWLATAMLCICALLMALVGFMLVYLLTRKQTKRMQERWRNIHRDLVQRAIFWEPAEGEPSHIPVHAGVARSLLIPLSRQVMITELINGKKGLSGTAATNLVLLYRQLGLERDSLDKLASRKWHLQAQGIQELAVMEQRSYVTRLYRFTNAHNEVVRREAQAAIVQLYGFEGLRFLEIIDTPLSEWQQIQLLRLLQHATGMPQGNILRWLDSANETVRIFTLKLVAEQHLQELAPKLRECLQDSCQEVRLQAVRCMRELGATDSCPNLVTAYPAETPAVQLAILHTLGHIGTEAEVEFVGTQLSAPDNSIKLEAARALVRLGDAGLKYLELFPFMYRSPWNQILRQAKTEWMV
jgi:hypothetical protein